MLFAEDYSLTEIKLNMVAGGNNKVQQCKIHWLPYWINNLIFVISGPIAPDLIIDGFAW